MFVVNWPSKINEAMAFYIPDMLLKTKNRAINISLNSRFYILLPLVL
jgi:hypothetical protein